MIYKVHNVLSDWERKKIIKDIQPFLMNREQMNIHYNNTHFYPGKQTDDILHLKPEFASLIKKILDKIKKEIKLDLKLFQCWVKWSNGRKNHMNWHNHIGESDIAISYACVYYLKTLPFLGNGTLFEDGFVRAPQNSMIIFPAHLMHTTPKYPLPFIDRYVMSINLSL